MTEGQREYRALPGGSEGDDLRSEQERQTEREGERVHDERVKEGSEYERDRERKRGSEESNRQWIRVSYRGMKGSSLREARGAPRIPRAYVSTRRRGRGRGRERGHGHRREVMPRDDR